MNPQEQDQKVRQRVYEVALATGTPPGISVVADALGMLREAVEASLQRLAEAHVLVLQPESREILMAAPFSAVPTPFLVRTPRYSCFANCVWDALGIAAMLGADAEIETSCQDCGAPMSVAVESGSVSDEGLVHFAIPAKEWWTDIVFT
jgi:alkylmercury lyase-like protein